METLNPSETVETKKKWVFSILLALCCQKSKEYATRKPVAKKSVLDPSDTVETQPLAEVSSRLPDTCRATRREQFSVEKIIKLDKKKCEKYEMKI